jgi:hypothetical protein
MFCSIRRFPSCGRSRGSFTQIRCQASHVPVINNPDPNHHNWNGDKTKWSFGCAAIGVSSLVSGIIVSMCEEPPKTTLEVETVPNWRCPSCGGTETYLDAAVNMVRCAYCDTAVVDRKPKEIHDFMKVVAYGGYDLGSGATVMYFPLKDKEHMMENLMTEVDWFQRNDILENDQVVRQPRLIAYQAIDPTNKGFIIRTPILMPHWCQQK